MKNDITGTPKLLTVVLSGKLHLPLTPDNISTVALYHINLNLWGTLLDSNQKSVISKLARTSPDRKTFIFDILPNARFSNGRKITADDVKFSFDRLISRQSRAHLNAKSLFRKVTIINETRFSISLQKRTSVFLFLLSIPEMGIVPREACDTAGNIKSLEITSGAYFIHTTTTESNVTLEKNPYYEGHESGSPERVTIFFKEGSKETVEAVSHVEPDFIDVLGNGAAQTLENMRASRKYIDKLTRPSMSLFLVNQSKAMDRSQRVTLARLINSNFLKVYSTPAEIEKPSFEILPLGTFGSLGLREPYLNGEIKTENLPQSLTLAALDFTAPATQAVVTILERAGITVKKTGLWDNPDFDVGLWGQGMNTDFPELEFHLSMVSPWRTIPASNAEKMKIRNILAAEDLTTRHRLIQNIGKEILNDGRVIPLLLRSYIHLYKPSRVNIDSVTTYDGDIRFWKMKVLAQ